MAISGQVRLCASGWGMGAILLVTIPAAAQEKRSFEVHVSGAAIYDSNAAGASKVRAAARGLVQEEMEFRPSINANLVLPFDDHVFFLDTQAGYEFHSRNKRLESERITVDGSARLRIGGCSIQPGLGYARQLSDITDIYTDAVGNVEEVTSVRGALKCERTVGLSPVASGSYTRFRNEQASRQRSDVDTVTASAGIAYAQPSLGTLSLFATLADSTYPNRRFGPALVQDGIRTLSGTVQLERRIGTRLQGGISVGYVSVDPELKGVKSLDGFSYGADLAYMPGGPAKFTLAADRAVEASNRLNVSYYRQDQIRLGMSYVISPRINADLRASCRIRRFALSPAVIDITQPRKERSYRLGGGLTWLANQRIGLSIDIDYQRRDASGTLFDFDGVRVGLSANYRI